MNTLEKNLRCPLCLSFLKKTGKTMICIKNKHSFVIEQGIPVLVDYSSLPIHSQNQQIYFEKRMRKYIIDSPSTMSFWKKKYLERFVSNFKKIKNRSVIEVGVGSGYMAISLAILGAKVVACDLTIRNLVAMKKFAKTLGLEHNMSFVCCSADKLPFKESVFDYFILNSVLEHIPKEKEAIRGITRLLKKGGGLMITVPVRYRYIFPLLLPLNFFHDRTIGHLRRYDMGSIRRKFPDFSIKRMYFTGHILKVVKVVINLFAKIYDEETIEEKDSKKDDQIMWSSNLIAFLNKK